MGVKHYKFVPEPGDAAGLKLRRLMDNKNEREAIRKKKKAAAKVAESDSAATAATAAPGPGPVAAGPATPAAPPPKPPAGDLLRRLLQTQTCLGCNSELSEGARAP